MVFSDIVKDALVCYLEDMLELDREVTVRESNKIVRFECDIRTKFNGIWCQLFVVPKVSEEDIDEDNSLDYLSYLNICQALYDTAYGFDVVDHVREFLNSYEGLTMPGLKTYIGIMEYKQEELGYLWADFTEAAAGLVDD